MDRENDSEQYYKSDDKEDMDIFSEFSDATDRENDSERLPDFRDDIEFFMDKHIRNMDKFSAICINGRLDRLMLICNTYIISNEDILKGFCCASICGHIDIAKWLYTLYKKKCNKSCNDSIDKIIKQIKDNLHYHKEKEVMEHILVWLETIRNN